MTADLDEGAAVRTTMERALRDVHAPTGLGPDSIASGRRLRARRRLGVTAGAVAAVAALAAVTVPFAGGGTNKAVDDTAFAASTSVPPTAADGLPSVVDPGDVDPWPNVELPEGWWDMPTSDMLAALEDRLPAGVHVIDPDPLGEGLDGTGRLDVAVEGPTGTGLISLLLRGRPLDQRPPPVTSTDAEGNTQIQMMAETVPYARNVGCRKHHLACTLIRDGSGTAIGDVSTERDGGTTYHNGDLLGPDGGAVNLYVADSTGEKPGYAPPTAEAPVLTSDQVLDLIQDPIWTSYQP